MDSRVPLDVIFPPPPAATKQWPEYVRDQQQQLQSIYHEMRANGQVAIGRATAYQMGRVTRVNRIEVGDVVYYFSPRVTRDANNQISKKLALCGLGCTGWWASQARAWPLSSPWATGLGVTRS